MSRPRAEPLPRRAAGARGGVDAWPLAPKLLLATLLLFGLTHLVGLVLLTGTSPRVLDLMHGLRTLVLVALVALLVDRHYRGNRRRVLLRAALRQEPAVVDEEESIRRNSAWYVNLRWFAVSVVAASVVLAVPVGHMLPERVFLPLVVLTLALACSNLVFRHLVEVHGGSRRFLLAQVLSDLLFLTLLLHYSGGIENPISAAFLFHVILGGILLSRRQAYSLAGAGSVLYLLLGTAELARLVPHYSFAVTPLDPAAVLSPAYDGEYVATHVGVMVLLLFGCTYLTTLVAERLRSTERLLLDAARTAREEKLRLEGVVDASGAGLAVLDANGHTLWRNIRAERWLRSLAGPDTDGSRPTDDLARLALEKRSRREEEYVVEAPSGHRRHFHVTATPVMDAEGRPGQVVQLVQDVTARRTAEEGLLQAAKLAGIGELAGSVAHELNNPLGVLSAKARLLLQREGEGEMSEKVRTELEKIVVCADRMAGITGGLLAFARRSTGVFGEVDVNDAVRRAVDFLDSRTRRSEVTVECGLGSNLPLVRGNLTELQQVLVNLAINALDAMPEGGVLRLATRPLADHSTGRTRAVVVDVADTGPGIPPAERRRIFEPFYSTKPEGRGTGLGLPICQRIVTAHSGSIQVVDARSGGALFRITLPVPSTNGNG